MRRGSVRRSVFLFGAGISGILGWLSGCRGDEDVEQPSPLSAETAIEYPLELWDQDVEGRTVLRVRVNERGRVDSTVVLESSGHPEFDSAAVEGARSMHFEPARKGDEVIRVWARVPVHFSKEPPPDSLSSR